MTTDTGAKSSPDWFVGAMSGTSLDGVDAVAVEFEGDGRLRVAGHVHRTYPPLLRAELRSLNLSGPNEIHRGALAANGVALAYAESIVALRAVLPAAVAQRIVAIGAHGQTVRHRPGPDGSGYSVQLLNGSLLAERSGIDVICDFRGRDVAAGGQGAPLVPAFHAAIFGARGEACAVLNLGGIANLSLIAADGRVTGFDCGPGNALLDAWCLRNRGCEFDADGAWGAQGQVVPELLDRCLGEPFLSKDPPKSTGLDLFNPKWINSKLEGFGDLRAQDAQATFCEFTARCAADALSRHLPAAARLLVCGGGAFNSDLMRRLAARLPDVKVRSTDSQGLPPDQVEAAAFAWLARSFLRREPANRVEVTGASGPRILGAYYPA